MSSNKGYSWSAEHLLPVDFEEGQSGCESVDKQVGVVCRVVLLRVKVLTHATHAHTTKHIVSHIFGMTLLLERESNLASNICCYHERYQVESSISSQFTIASTFEIRVDSVMLVRM